MRLWGLVLALSCGRGELSREARPQAPQCLLDARDERPPPECVAVHRDLAAIRAAGTLTVALPPDATSCFLDAGQIRGFEYELLRSFAMRQGVQLELVAVPTIEARIDGLQTGRFDLIAGRLPEVEAPGVSVVELVETGHTLVQSIDAFPAGRGVRAAEDLAGRRVVAVEGAGHRPTLAAVGARIDALPDGTSAEALVRWVRLEGGVGVLRTDLAERLAAGDLVVGPSLPGRTGAHVAVRSGATALGAALVEFVEGRQEQVESLYGRYVGEPKRARPRVSSFDGLFRSQARSTEWRWTVLAAVAWQESRFDPAARSFAGAMGLMQIMPGTADLLGLTDRSDPVQSVRGGARYLRMLDRRFAPELPDAEARLPFVLASYNAGAGHVDDARALARLAGHDDHRWPSVAPWLLALESPRFYRDPAVQHGYCRGTEPVDYVRRVIARRDLYDALVDAAE